MVEDHIDEAQIGQIFAVDFITTQLRTSVPVGNLEIFDMGNDLEVSVDKYQF